MSRPKFEQAERKRVRNRVRELAPFMTYKAVAETMNREGFKRPDGSALTPIFVGNQASAIGIRGHKKHKRSKRYVAPKTTQQLATVKPNITVDTYTDNADANDRWALADLIFKSDFAKDRKIRLITELI